MYQMKVDQSPIIITQWDRDSDGLIIPCGSESALGIFPNMTREGLSEVRKE